MPSHAYLTLLDEMRALHIAKSAGYSGAENPDAWANFRIAEEFGVLPETGALIRMSDKWARVKSLLRNPDNEQVGESIEDTLKDLAAYALIYLCLRRERQAGGGPERNVVAL